MSQEKVDRYKQQKGNRQKLQQREKLLFRLEMAGAGLILAALIVWFSMAVYSNNQAKKESERPTTTTTMNVTELQDYLSGLTSDSEEASEK